MKNIILILYCVISTGCLTEEQLIRRTSSHLAKILEAQPGTGRLEKLIVVDDARFTLLHIRQQHYSDIYTARVIEGLAESRSDSDAIEIKRRYFEVISKVGSVQKEIIDFLLEECTKTDVIYSEGLPFPNTYREQFIKKYLEGIKKEVLQVASYRGSVNFKYPSPPYFTGASIFLKEHHEFKVFGVEQGNLLDLILSTYSSKTLAPSLKLALIKECHAEREQQMLINMADDLDELPYLEPSLKFLICGSKHDFRDDVVRWNKENPKKRYNLLIFTPNTLIKK